MPNSENIKPTILVICLALFICLTGCSNSQALNPEETILHDDSLTKFAHPDRWKENIGKFTAQDGKNPPPQNAVLFVGSSSIVGWNTQKWFSDIKTINRGFGGSYVIDSLYYADSIIIPYKPKTIVLYAGDNDIADGKSPEMVFTDFKAFAAKIRKSLPEAKLIFVSIKPSIDRWKFWPRMRKANGLISKYCEKQKNMYFVDMSKVMLDASGQPRKEVFSPDGLHMNETGYRLWTSQVRPFIDK